MRIIIDLPENVLTTLEETAKEQNRSRKNLIETILINYSNKCSAELLETLQQCLSFLADLNGSNWIEGNDPGEQDMKQRAKANQLATLAAIKKATE